uniref:Uncharacterized protein n=1 Tax=Cannabis sativa TaxID=3483 RepID=A0A803PR27_CANSA
MRKSSNQLLIDANKSPEAENEVSSSGIDVSTAGIVEKQPTGLTHQVKFFGSRSEMVLLEPSCPLPLEVGTEGSQAFFLVHATHHRASQWVEMLEIELRQIKKHRNVIAKKWSDSEAGVSRTKDEAEKQHQGDQQKIKELQNSFKFLQANLVKKQVDHDQKLKELEGGTKESVNNIGRRTIYQIWSANPELDFSLLGDKAETMLAYCEKTQKEEYCKEEEVDTEQENLAKSLIIM